MQRGLLLFAHGARDPRWALPFEAVAERARAETAAAHPPPRVMLSFLEFMSPGLIDAGKALAQAGCTSVDVVPLFLGAGGHVRKDLPVLLDQLRTEHPDVTWSLRPAVGEAPEVIAAMATVAAAWLGRAEQPGEAQSHAGPESPGTDNSGPTT